MNDIMDTSDIKMLIDTFYNKVKSDLVIGYFFNDVINVDWDHHLPKMYEFWSKVVFSEGNYHGNPMSVHQSIHSKSTMTVEHFEHWIYLFHATVDELFHGENADLIKDRAQNIAAIMVTKILKFD